MFLMINWSISTTWTGFLTKAKSYMRSLVGHMSTVGVHNNVLVMCWKLTYSTASSLHRM